MRALRDRYSTIGADRDWTLIPGRASVLIGSEGLGRGDAKLIAAIGARVSWQGLPTVIVLGTASGRAFALLQSFAGRKAGLDTRLPFGSLLALGGWLVRLYGPLVVG